MTPVVVMGVSGKSTLALAIARSLERPFLEGDDLHPAVNIARMHSGRALDDAGRAPWLDAVWRTPAAWRAARR